MPGPFTSYAPPGPYTRTLLDPALAGLAGGLRIPVLIGVSSETIRVDDLEMFRGSSANTDSLIVDEDLSDQIFASGELTNEFFLANTPIVTGEGTGQVTNRPSDVTDNLGSRKSTPFSDSSAADSQRSPSTLTITRILPSSPAA